MSRTASSCTIRRLLSLILFDMSPGREIAFRWQISVPTIHELASEQLWSPSLVNFCLTVRLSQYVTFLVIGDLLVLLIFASLARCCCWETVLVLGSSFYRNLSLTCSLFVRTAELVEVRILMTRRGGGGEEKNFFNSVWTGGYFCM